jgi:hypothetical protein
MYPAQYVGTDRPDVLYSHWRSGPMTFGPIGRVVVTLGLLAFLAFGLSASGPWSPFALWFFFGWSILASFVLRDIWKRTPLSRDARGPGAWLRRRFPSLSRPLATGTCRILLGVPIAIALVVFWLHADVLGRFALAVIVTMAGTGSLLVWLADQD